MGDTGNAADSLVGQVSGVGYTSLGSLNEISWLAKDTTGAMYEYSAGALSFAVGLGQTEEKEDFASAAVKYSTDAYSIALGYENNNSEGTQWSALGSATVSAATVKAKVAKADGLDTEYALSLDYAISGATVTGYYTHDYTDSDSYGLGASYDLGGGASVVGGVVNSDHLNDTAFDLGVKMSF
jgi:outer membrane protein OmpU